MDNSVLIVGEHSYIGTHLAALLKETEQVELISVRNDDWKGDSFGRFDVVVYCAGIAHVKETDDNRQLYFKINRDLAVEVAKKAKADGVRQFIYLSSMSVYGIVTGHITAETEPAPVSAYGSSKLEAENMLFELADDSFIVSAVRPPMVYGEGCKGNYQLLRKFALKFHCFPAIYNERSMISIDNLSTAIRDMIERPKSGLFFPQDPAYVHTCDMVRQITEQAGYRFRYFNLFNPMIRLLMRKSEILKKVFGSLTYDLSLSGFVFEKNVGQVDDLVSIIMPMYNAERYVEASVRSVKKQDYDNWELIIINDGSTDESERIVQGLSRTDTRIRLISKANSGIADTRNVGILAAKGRYLAFLDSDDQWEEHKLARQMELLKNMGERFCYTATRFVDDGGNPLDYWWPVPSRTDYRRLLKSNVIPGSSVLIDRLGIKNFTVPRQGHEDYATWLTILRENGIDAVGINEPLLIYRRSTSGTSRKKLRTISWTWHVYHDSQGFGVIRSTFCLIRFELLTIKKYFGKYRI